ncbi:hypothetical protein ACQP2K_03495 [Microbispora siamensis]
MVDSRAAEGVTIERLPVPSYFHDLPLGSPNPADLFILPQRVRDGRAEYRAEDISTLKALRQAGVNTQWAHSSSERTYASEYSSEVALAVAMFIGQTLAEESVVSVVRILLTRIKNAWASGGSDSQGPTMTVSVGRFIEDGRTIENLKISGPGEQVVDAVRELLRGDQA